MKGYLVLFVVAIVVAVGASPVDEVWSYHESVGIPLAARLKKSEQADLSRIVGGTPSFGKHPYMVGVVVNLHGPVFPWDSICGASLLSNTRSLTAAQCWYDGRRWARMFTMVFGSRTLHSGGLRIDTDDVQVHPNWLASVQNRRWDNNIAIVRHSPVEYNDVIQPIRLPNAQEQNRDFVNTWAVVVGYGRTSPNNSPPIGTIQRDAHMRVLSNEACMQRHWPVYASTMCATPNVLNGINVCTGDSGGPFVLENDGDHVLIGVTRAVAGSGPCLTGVYSLFTRVTSYLPWIKTELMARQK